MAPGPRANRPPHILLVILLRSSKNQCPYGPNDSKKARAPLVSRGVAFAAAVLACLVLASVLYGIKAPGGKEAAESPACPGAAELAARLKPLVHGEIAALTLAPRPKLLPGLGFDTPEGTKASLADFKGRTVLLNLWATWCVPCRHEMPALERLQGMFGSKDFAVVAVNIDTARLDRPKAFLDEIGVKNLKLYTDNTAAAFQTLKQAGKVLGLPTTILISKDGCEIGTMAGPAQWDSEEALALLNAIQG
jgi:thiol-disulfide isomerase/thioredoxin